MSINCINTISNFLKGIGTLMVGIGAIVALCQTGDVIREVLKIQEQSKSIQTAVQDIKIGESLLEVGIQDIRKGVELLINLIKQFTAKRTVESFLNEPNPSLEQIDKALKNIPVSPIDGQIYLPMSNREQVVDKIYNAKTPYEREIILQNSLKYDSSVQRN